MAGDPDPDAGRGAGPVPDAPATGIPLRHLLAFCIGQLGLHAVMAGLRMSAPLQLLREGYGAGSVGLMLALFAAAPVLTAMWAGRLADRHGYHRPVLLSLLLSAGGAACAVASTFVDGAPHFALLCLAAMASGTGANTGMMAIMRTAGLVARNSTERVRIFSWLGVAPPFANVIGPVSAGLMIDFAGFRAAFLLMCLFTGLTVWSLLQVPRGAVPVVAGPPAPGNALGLLREPGMKRLILANWVLSTCWDAHTFAVPIIGHERGFSASTIGLILGVFTLAVTGIRLVIPMLAHRLDETQVLRATMWGAGLVMAVYPFAATPWAMGACSVLLGIALGSSQPMVMTTLHHLSPPDRHGQALALRSLAINLSSTLMPLAFGAAGLAVGTAVLFWFCGASSAAAAWTVRRYPPHPAQEVPLTPPGPGRPGSD
jgi:MFS family permease